MISIHSSGGIMEESRLNDSKIDSYDMVLVLMLIDRLGNDGLIAKLGIFVISH